jgi:hypothetical protein
MKIFLSGLPLFPIARGAVSGFNLIGIHPGASQGRAGCEIGPGVI